MSTPPQVFRFGTFELDSGSRELRRHGLRVRLPEQPFQILTTLLNRRGDVVTRNELRQVLWTSETFVDFEAGLNSAVRKLREALDDTAENPRFVETLPRRGYRFIASVTESGGHRDPSSDDAAEGEGVLASDPEPVAEQSYSPADARATPPPPLRSALGSSRAAGLLLIVVLAGAVAGPYRRGVTALRVTPVTPILSVVVLPFENLTGDASQEYLVDAVTDGLTAHLAQVSGLDVISATSARSYKGTARLLAEIGSELKVDGVVEGAVGRSGAGVRITAKLTRAATDRHVWSQNYQGEAGDVLALQQRIASDVAVAAGRSGSRVAARIGAINPEAHDAYLKGLTARGRQRHEGYATAVGYFEEAVAKEPRFAEAYAALALAQLQFLYAGPLSPHDTIPKAEAAARKALQLDQTVAEAHWALGQILSLYYWRWTDGEKTLQRAAELQGNRNELSGAVTESLIRGGRFSDAIAAAERGRRLDPLSVHAQIVVGSAYRAAGQHERAITELRRALEMNPGQTRAHFQLGVTFVAMGRLDDAIREFEPAARSGRGHNSRVEAYLGYAYAAVGRTQEARAVLKELASHRREQYVSSFGIALIHDALGEKEPALAALQRAYEDRAVEFAQMANYPPFRTIGSEGGYRAVMRNVGLPGWRR